MSDGGNGGVYMDSFQPPSPAELKQQWEQSYRNRPIEVERKMDKNRKQAIKEILQEQNRMAVKPNAKLDKIFRENIGK